MSVVWEVALYAATAAVDFHAAWRCTQNGHVATRRLALLFGVASLLRCFWVGVRHEVEAEEDEDSGRWENALRVINRLAMLIQFSAVSLLVSFWENLRFRFDEAKREQRLLRVVAVANVLLYLGILLTSCVNSMYDDNIVAIAVSFELLAGFIFYGAVQLRRLLEAALRTLANASQVRVAVRKLNFIATTTVVLYTGRCALFLYDPLVGERFDGELGSVLYPWFFYEVPEIVSNLTIVVTLCYPLPCFRSGAAEDARALTRAADAQGDAEGNVDLLERPSVESAAAAAAV